MRRRGARVGTPGGGRRSASTPGRDGLTGRRSPLGLEPDAPTGAAGHLHEIAYCVEHDAELCVVLLLERGQLARELLVAHEHPAEPNERAHDLDVHSYGAPAAQDAR